MTARHAAPNAATSNRPRAMIFAGITLVLLLTTLVVARGADGWSEDAAPVAAASRPTPSLSSSPSPDAEQVAEDARNEALTDRLKTLDTGGATLSVTVLDLSDGRSAHYNVNSGLTYDTASIVKIDILATLLLQAQDDGRALTAREKSYAVPMIVDSDNAAADALWEIIGGSDGLNAANERLGLTGTTAGTGPLWGLTQTTAADQLTLLSDIFGNISELTADSQDYIRDLMGGISDGQDWGVSAAGDPTGLKNGWLERSATSLWDISSVGEVTIGDHPCLLAVLSKDNAGMDAGISLVEKAAKETASVMEQSENPASPSS
ncbi:serine hydrolase [Streptomyces sp. NPDC051217]|uniref:serine hydrolase n=1 Tax=Streptomyces sp. NPDC051217 TaxID=3365644 RepID=UPI003798EE90